MKVNIEKTTVHHPETSDQIKVYYISLTTNDTVSHPWIIAKKLDWDRILFRNKLIELGAHVIGEAERVFFYTLPEAKNARDWVESLCVMKLLIGEIE